MYSLKNNNSFKLQYKAIISTLCLLNYCNNHFVINFEEGKNWHHFWISQQNSNLLISFIRLLLSTIPFFRYYHLKDSSRNYIIIYSRKLLFFICDRIWQKRAWMHTASIFGFHYQHPSANSWCLFPFHFSSACFPHGLFLWTVVLCIKYLIK